MGSLLYIKYKTTSLYLIKGKQREHIKYSILFIASV